MIDRLRVVLKIIWRKYVIGIWRKLRVCRSSASCRQKTEDLAMSCFHQLQPHLEQNRPLRVVAAEAGIPFRTAQRWVAQYPKRGLAALCFCQ